jgi:hypothetical protein
VWVDLSADDAKTLAAGLAALRNATEAAGIGVMTAVEEADG